MGVGRSRGNGDGGNGGDARASPHRKSHRRAPAASGVRPGRQRRFADACPDAAPSQPSPRCSNLRRGLDDIDINQCLGYVLTQVVRIVTLRDGNAIVAIPGTA